MNLKISTSFVFLVTTVFADTRKQKNPRKRFQNFRQPCVLLTDRIEIHQLQPLLSFSTSCYRAVIGGFRFNLSITSKTDGKFGNVSAGVLFSKVAETSVHIMLLMGKKIKRYCGCIGASPLPV